MSSDTDVLAVVGSELVTFTPANWSVNRSITVQAEEDIDVGDEVVQLGLSASGGGFDGVANSLTYNVDDDEIPGLLTTVSSITMQENSSYTVGIRLNAQPLAGVTVTLTCLLYTSPSPRDRTRSRMPSSA